MRKSPAVSPAFPPGNSPSAKNSSGAWSALANSSIAKCVLPSLSANPPAPPVFPCHFHRAFTAVHQQTPHACGTALRLAHARASLENGTTVAATAHPAGFSNSPAFTRLFRAHFGVNPSQIRKIG